MSEQLPVHAPHLTGQVEVVRPPLPERPSQELAPPTPEQARAVEAAFAQDQQQEHNLVAGLMGLWAGTMLLHDMAADAHAPPAGEEEPRRQKRGEDEEA
ncbi:MAG TPA: hypothetical protein VFA26_19640 [Gemmataceae bacterium]|nr:hypothetical protein [Gemmataceae bacterium]